MSTNSMLGPIVREALIRKRIELNNAEAALDNAIKDEQRVEHYRQWALDRQKSRRADIEKFKKEIKELEALL